MDWHRKWIVDFKTGKSQLVSFDRSNNTGVIFVKIDGCVLEEKSPFKMLGSSNIAKTASKKIGALILSMEFLSPEVAQYLYESTIW